MGSQDSEIQGKEAQGMISLLHTGGTILSTKSDALGIFNGSQSTEDNSKRIKEILTSDFNFKERSLLNLDSADMLLDDQISIAVHINAMELDDPHKYKGYVIVHGSDTMEYTAALLGFTLNTLKKPVILTGAMLSIEDPNSDGGNNVVNAFKCASLDTLHGVHIAFGDRLSLGVKAKKMHTTTLDTFQTPGFDSVGTFENKDHGDTTVAINRQTLHDLSQVLSVDHGLNGTKLSKNVHVVTMRPSLQLSIFDYYLEQGAKGIVVEGYGDGNVPSVVPSYNGIHASGKYGEQFYDKIKMCLDKGVHVVLSTQCIEGFVAAKYAGGKKLIDSGVLSAQNMTTVAAYTKLAYLIKNSKNVRSDFKKNIAGELL